MRRTVWHDGSCERVHTLGKYVHDRSRGCPLFECLQGRLSARGSTRKPVPIRRVWLGMLASEVRCLGRNYRRSFAVALAL
jgi:hypothetical protein